MGYLKIPTSNFSTTNSSSLGSNKSSNSRTVYLKGNLGRKNDEPWTTSRVLGNIYKLYDEDPERARKMYSDLKTLQSDPSSKYYNPYSTASNKSVAALSEYGIDTSNINDEWYNQNSWLTQYLNYDGTTNTPTKPGKNASDAEKAAYEYYQIWKSEDATKKAESQWEALQSEITYWTQRSDRNYSDDEILGMIDWSKYGELESMRKNAQYQPNEYNRAIGFSDDALHGVIWKARNPEYEGDLEGAMAYSYLGWGNGYQYNPEIAEKLDPTNEKYKPYSLGSTNLDQAAAYFGVSSFEPDWCSKHTDLLNGSDDDKKYYQMVYNAEQTTQSAEKAVDALNGWMESRNWSDMATAKKDLDNVLATGKIYVKDGKYSMYKRDGWEAIDLSVLNKMDMTMGKGDNPPTADLLAMTRGVDYKYADALHSAYGICAKNDEVGDGYSFINKSNDIAAGPMNDISSSIINSRLKTGPEGDYDDLRSKADAEYAEKAQSDYERGQEKVNAMRGEEQTEEPQKEGPTVPEGGYDDLMQDQYAAYAETQQGRYYSDADLAQAKENDEKVRRAADTTEGIATEEETTVMQNAGSVTYEPVKGWMGEIFTTFQGVPYIAQATLGRVDKRHFNTMQNDMYVVGTYNMTKDRLASNEEEMAEFTAEYGDINAYKDALGCVVEGQPLTRTFDLDSGLQVDYTYDPETKTFKIAEVYDDYGTLYARDGETRKFAFEENGLDFQTCMDEINENINALNNAAARYEGASDEGKQWINAMRSVSVQIDDDKKYLEENQADYEVKSASVNESMRNLETTRNALEMLGIDTAPIDETMTMLSYTSGFYDEPRIVCESETPLQKLNEYSAGQEVTNDQKTEYLLYGIEEINREIDKINMSLERSDELGYELPDRIRKNMGYRLEDLEYMKKSYEYDMLMVSTDPEEYSRAAEVGELFCRERNSILNSFPGSNYHTDDMPYATDEERQLYYYLVGKNVLASGADMDELLDIRSYHNSLGEAHSALDRYMTDADEYATHMNDDDHGAWRSRNSEEIAKAAKGMVDSGTLGGVAVNIAGTLLSGVESVESALYILDRALGSKRINPKTRSRDISVMKENARAATFESIDKVYENNPLARTLARFGYEVYANRGDSLVNSVGFGWLVPSGLSDGWASIIGASPMGFTAALNAAAHAVERGASTEQAWVIAGATFVSETATEALTLKHITDALNVGSTLTKDSVKEFVVDWLTKEGLEEMAGESINDMVENWFDSKTAEWFDTGFMSEFDANMNKYRAMNYSDQDAWAMAMKDQVEGVLHTAIVSYLSPGAGVFMKAGKAALNTMDYYHSAAQYNQETGNDKSMWGMMLEDWRNKKNKDIDTSMPGQEAGVNPQYQAAQAQANASDEQTNAYAKKQKEDYERGQAAKEASEQEAGTAVPSPTQKQTATEVVAIDQAKDADKSTKAAVMASVLSTKSKNGTDFKADAAAAFITRTFGNNGDQIVQETLIGAENAGINTRDVKTAIKNAALGEGTATTLVQSEAFQKATPEEKARMLVETIPADAQSKQVNRNINARILDFRRGRVYTQLATEGHFAQAEQAKAEAVDAAKATAEAQTQLDEKQDALDSAIENQQTINQQFQQDPSTDNLKQQQDAITKVDNADESRKQYEEHLKKQQDAQTEAEDKAEKATAEAMNSARTIADERIAQEDQMLSEKEAQVVEEERIAAEQAEKSRVEKERNDNADYADMEDFIARKYPDATEEEKQRVREMVPQIAEQMRQEQQAAQAEQATQAAEQTAEQAETAKQSNEPTTNYNPNFSEQENKTIKRVYEKFNVPMLFTDTTETRNGNTFRSEGYYQEGTHQIILDKNMSYDEVMTRVLPHELLHSMEKSDSYNNVVDAVFGYTYGEDSSIAQAVKNLENGGKPTTRIEMDIMAIKAKYDAILGTDMSISDASKELAATRMGELFYNPDNPQRSQDLVNRLVADQPSLARQVMNSIKTMIKKALGLKGAWLSNAQKTVDMFEQALAANKDANATQGGETKYSFDTLKKVSKAFIEKLQYIADQSPFAKEYKAWNKNQDSTKLLTIGKPSDLLQYYGVPDREIKISGGKLIEIKNEHPAMTDNVIRQIPSILESPVLIMKSQTRENDTITMFGELVDKNGYPVLAAVAITPTLDEKNNVEFVVLRSAYGKDQNPQGFIDKSTILYKDETRADSWAATMGLQLPSGHTQIDSSGEMVTQDNQSVNRSLTAERVAEPAATDVEGDVLTESLPGDTQTKYSLSSWTDKEVKAVRKNLLKNGFTAEQADKWINDVNSVAAVIAADKDRLDFTPDRDQKFKKPNGDVYKWTLDASTLCAKRLLYQGTFNEIQKMLPNTPLRPGDLIELANMMHEMGYQTPCGICYVESRRRHLGNFTEEFLQSYEGEYKPTYAELTSTDGLAKLKQEHRQAYDDYIAAMNGKGVASPKVVQLRTDYRGDVRSLNKDSIAYLNSIGGLRIQSFSDFETPHLMDMMQAVMDMSAVKLKSQAYTKVPNFAWVFGDTGIKINLSLMGEGTGVDENGNLVFSSTEGMDFDEAMKLRNRYSKNVGTILVGMNDEHIIAAMADPRIDYIIPFHKSGWSQEELSKMKALENYTDYQNTQNELWITGQNEDGTYQTKSIDKKTGNLDPYGEDGYWDYKKSGQENAETYLELCAKQKRLPKFSQFLVDNGDGTFSLPQGDDARSTAIREGYWKTLIDFKMYDNEGNGAEQEAVMPNVNMPEAYRVLNEYEAPEGGNNALPKAEPVAERFVEWYNETHNGLAAAAYQNMTLGNTESEYVEPAVQQNAMAIDENGETKENRYSLPSDAPYLSAVNHGDMETAQELVDRAANEMGYTIKGYHGTASRDFTVFDKSKAGQNWNGDSRYGPGFYFAFDKDTALKWTDGMRVIDAWLKMERPLDLRGETPKDIENAIREKAKEKLNNYDPSFPLSYEQYASNLDRIVNIEIENPGGFINSFKYDKNGKMTDGIREFLSSLGYDGIIADGEMVVFDPEQIKSADPVTYDDNGNVIPLSERFNDQKDDIRYSLPSNDLLEQQIREYLMNGGSLSENTTPSGSNLPGTTGMNPQRQFGSQTAQTSNALHDHVKDYLYNHSSYTPDTNQAQVDRAMNWVKSLSSENDPDGYYAALNRVTNDNFDYRSADGQARMLTVMSMAALKAETGDRSALNDELRLADAFNKQGTDLGRQLQARKIFRLMTPVGRQSVLQGMCDDINEQLGRKGINKTVMLSNETLQAAGQAQTEEEFAAVRKQAAKELAEQMPSNWKDKVRSLRMLSMLANPRTHIRNIVGNMLFVPAVGLKNKISAVMELGLDKGERTKTLSPILSKDARTFARNDAKDMKGILTGEAKFNETTSVQNEQKAFKGALQKLIDANSWALEGEDWIFLKGHYRRALGGWMMANGYTSSDLQNNPSLLEKGRTYAVEEAQKATYRDFNQLASTLNSVSQKGGVAGFLTDAVLPFKKTPANILRRGIEYSPVGIVRSLTTDLYHLKQYNDYQNGKISVMPDKAISPNQFIDKLCSGLSGTAIMAVGALLSSAGIISCGLDDDDDEFEKAKGNQKYSIKFNIGGQDYTYTIDWAAPMSMPFFVGAAIQEQMQSGTEFDIEDLIDAFGNITEPVFNLSMLDGVNTLFKTSQYDDTNTLTQIGAKILSNYATSYVPSALGAIARINDDTQRKAFVESGKGTGVMGTFRYALEQVENKIPGLSKSNIPVRNIWGEEKKSGAVERHLENLVSPGYFEEYKNDPVIDEMRRLWDATGDKALIPDADPDKTITVNKEKRVLTAEQWDQYKETRGKTAHEMLTQLMDSEDYQNATDEAQAEMVKNVWSYADKVGKHAVFTDYDLDTNENPVAAAAKKGKTTVYESDMLASLDSGDYEGFDTMVEALRQEGVKDTEIKSKISNKYRDPYKSAYRKYMETGDEQYLVQMEEISETLGIITETSDIDFDVSSWEKQVDEKYGFNQ